MVIAMKLLLKRLGQISAFYLFIAVLLFVFAGRLDWWDAWLFLAVYYLIAVLTQVWMARNDPELSQERLQWGENTKPWDRWIVSGNGVLTLALLVVIGIDAGRFGWSSVPPVVRGLALLGFIPAFGLPLWASHVNTYLAATVRIQDERGHHVVSDGPYAMIRHPMYAGMLFYSICLPLLLNSWWGLTVSAALAALIILRTSLEDRTLQAELPGYREYAGQVRYRLIPGVW